jgi:hypothetical protein
VLACRPGRVRALEVHTSLAGDLPEDAAVHDCADVLLLHHAVGGPQQDVRRRPLEHLAAEADEVVHDLLSHDRAPDVALREAVAVRARRVLLEDLIEPLWDEPTLAVVRPSVGAVLDDRMSPRHSINQEGKTDLGVVDVLDVDPEVRIRGPRRPGRERKVDVNDEHAKDAPKKVVSAWKTVSTEDTERDQAHAPEVTEPAEGVERVDLAVVVAVPEVDVLLEHRLALDLLGVAPVRRAVRALLGRRVVRVRQP